jgi:16S rRNA (guanine527-N7)-methyltransferase
LSVSRETGSSEDLRLFYKQVRRWGLDLNEEQVEKLVRFTRLLAAEKTANVIGPRDFPTILLEHVLDSLSCSLFPAVGEARRILDVGSGAGLPGVPLKILNPGTSLAVVEATAKKARFIERAGQALGLKDVVVLNRRAEEVGVDPMHRASYDVVTARAVASLPVLAEYCLPLLRTGGHVIAMKGDPPEEEMRQGERAALVLGARVSEVVPVSRIAELEQKSRCLVVMEKISETPAKYPRKPGIARKKPLGI